MKDIQAILTDARKPGEVVCPKCKETFFAPMDKISIGLYGECSTDIEDQTKIDNLFSLADAL